MPKRNMLIPAIWCTAIALWTFPAMAEMVVDTAWVRLYNGPGNLGDLAWDIALDDSGNIYVTGSCDGTAWEPGDYATIKYYPSGDTAWVRTYDGSGHANDCAYGVAVDPLGSVCVTGYSYGDGTGYDYVTIKYYQDGDTAWVRRYNGKIGRAVAVDDSGNVCVTGESAGDFCTIRYHPDGDTAWVRGYNGPGNDNEEYPTVAVDALGNVYVTGGSAGSGTDYDYATIKYYASGDTAWIRRYDGPISEEDRARALAVDLSGNVYVSGRSVGPDTTYDFVTIKYYSNGDTAWLRRYSGTEHSHDAGNTIAVDDSGNVYVAGHSNWDYATVKYDRDGNELWAQKYKGPGDPEEQVRAIVTGGSGGCYVTGYSGGYYATIRYHPNGDTAWLRTYSGGEAVALAVDEFNNVYLTGFNQGGGTSSDYVTVKYFQALRGDVNGDSVMDLGDVVYLLNYLFKSGPAPEYLVIGDGNCDQVVDLGDAIYLLNYLFKNGPPPGCP